MPEIQALSPRTKGIKIEGKWYNYPDRLARFVEQLSAGDEVEFRASNKLITFIRKVGETTEPERKEEEGTPYTTQEQKIRFMALSLAVETSKSIVWTEEEPDIQKMLDTVLQIAEVYRQYLA